MDNPINMSESIHSHHRLSPTTKPKNNQVIALYKKKILFCVAYPLVHFKLSADQKTKSVSSSYVFIYTLDLAIGLAVETRHSQTYLHS